MSKRTEQHLITRTQERGQRLVHDLTVFLEGQPTPHSLVEWLRIHARNIECDVSYAEKHGVGWFAGG